MRGFGPVSVCYPELGDRRDGKIQLRGVIPILCIGNLFGAIWGVLRGSGNVEFTTTGALILVDLTSEAQSCGGELRVLRWENFEFFVVKTRRRGDAPTARGQAGPARRPVPAGTRGQPEGTSLIRPVCLRRQCRTGRSPRRAPRFHPGFRGLNPQDGHQRPNQCSYSEPW